MAGFEIVMPKLGESIIEATGYRNPSGDAIVIRHIMILSLTFDHRVIDGVLGGQFLNRMIFYLENFDTNQNL